MMGQMTQDHEKARFLGLQGMFTNGIMSTVE